MADKDLQAIRDAWDKESGGGRDEDKARALADKYVAKHPEQFDGLAEKSIHELVKAVDVFRDAGMDDEQWRIETYLLHRYNPQEIGGPTAATVRITGEGK